MLVFLWNEWNIDHIARHGVTPPEAEYVVRNAASPFPRQIGNDKFVVWGKTSSGRHLQVVFIHPDDDEIDIDSLVGVDLFDLASNDAEPIFVIHAMEMTDAMKRQLRRRRRKS